MELPVSGLEAFLEWQERLKRFEPTFPIWVSPRTDPGSECFLFQQFASPPCLARGDSSTFSSLRPRFLGSYTWNMLL